MTNEELIKDLQGQIDDLQNKINQAIQRLAELESKNAVKKFQDTTILNNAILDGSAITLDPTSYIKGGQTDYNTGTGFFLGYSNGLYKFSIGNPSGNYMIWDGTTLSTNTFYTSQKTGTTTRNMTTASGDQVIAHGLGKTPKLVKIHALSLQSYGFTAQSFGTYDGSTNSCVYYVASVDTSQSAYASTNNTSSFSVYVAAGYSGGDAVQKATVTVDATNITLSWTKVNSPTGTAYLMWEVIG